jgi:hypothetical protein
MALLLNVGQTSLKQEKWPGQGTEIIVTMRYQTTSNNMKRGFLVMVTLSNHFSYSANAAYPCKNPIIDSLQLWSMVYKYMTDYSFRLLFWFAQTRCLLKAKPKFWIHRPAKENGPHDGGNDSQYIISVNLSKISYHTPTWIGHMHD